MKKFGGIIVTVLVFIISAATVRFGINEYRQYNHDNNFNAGVKKAKDKIDNALINDASNRTDSEKLYDVSQDMMSEKLKNVSSNGANNKDKTFAAGVFAGQYGRLAIYTYDYCKTLGVDVSEFSNGYKNAHKELYVRAETILKRSGFSVEKTHERVRDTMLPYIKKEAEDIQTMFINQTGDNSFTLADSCNYYNQVARDPALMSSIKFSNVAPDAYRILMGSN